MESKTPLTQRQKHVFKILRDTILHRGMVPTIHELQEELGFKSSRGVICHLIALEKKGYIRREGRARGIRILKFKEKGKMKRDVSYLPLIGQIAAGSPILAEENIEEWVPVPSGMTHCHRSFLLRAKGDSMTGAHILNNDLVVVCPEHSPEEGDIVVALVGEEATVKRFFKKRNHIELKAENPKYEPMLANPGEVVIQGKVVGVLRSNNELSKKF